MGVVVIFIISEVVGLSVIRELSFLPAIGNRVHLSLNDRERLEKKAVSFENWETLFSNHVYGEPDARYLSFEDGFVVASVAYNLDDLYVRVYLRESNYSPLKVV